MSECSISIVLPAYNVEGYLGAALDSVKAQIEAPDELIIIDDGSADRTLDIANSYEFPFPYTVLSIENGGQGNARNIGASLASSEYIYFFDSDDILSELFVSSMKKEIVARGFPDIVLFSGESFNDVDYRGDRWINYRRGFSGVFESRECFLDNGIASRGLFCSPCLYISKKSIWEKRRLKFGPYYHEDEAILYPLFFECESFVVKDEVFFYRRNREGSSMTIAPNQKHVDGALDCIRMTLNLVQRDELSSRERWHIDNRLRAFLAMYIRLARRVGASFSYEEVLRAVWLTKDLRSAARAALYVTGADQSKLAKRAVRYIRSLRSVRKKK